MILAEISTMLFAQGCKIPYFADRDLSHRTLARPSEQPIVGGTLKLADFDDCQTTDEFGGIMEAWSRDGEDKRSGCSYTFDREIKLGQDGASLRLEYDVSSLNPAYNGFRAKLENRDLCDYEAVMFWVKGDREKGYTERFKMELKNADGGIGRCLVLGITDEWKQVTIPFADFKGITDFHAMSELDIVFDEVLATVKEGVVYIDDITFVSYRQTVSH